MLRTPRAAEFSSRASVERTAADWRNFVGRGGGSDRSALIPDHYAIGAGSDGTPETRVKSGLYSKISPGWHCNALQIASNVDSRIALALPFFKTEMPITFCSEDLGFLR